MELEGCTHEACSADFDCKSSVLTQVYRVSEQVYVHRTGPSHELLVVLVRGFRVNDDNFVLSGLDYPQS